MERNSQLVELIKQSFGYQRLLFYGMGVVAALTGVVILILSFAIPAKPGEESILLTLQVVSVVFILFGAWAYWYVRSREGRVLRLLFDQAEQIKTIKSVTVQSRGVKGRAIRIYTQDGKMVGFNVSGPQRQQALMALLRQHLDGYSITFE